MSSDLQLEASDIGGGNRQGPTRKGTEKIQFQTARSSREPSPTRKESRPSPNAMIASTKIAPNYRKKSARSTLSSREASPIRSKLTSAGKSSLSQNSNNTSSQQTSETSEGPLSPRTQRPQSNTPHWSPARLGVNKSLSSTSRSPAPSSRKISDPDSLNALPPSVIQLRTERIGNGQSEDSDDNLSPGMKTPRATASPALETVIESSLPSTPAIGTSRILANKMAAAQMQLPEKISERPETEKAEISSISTISRSAAESESESGYRSEDRQWQPPLQKPVTTAPSRFMPRRPTILHTGQNNETSSRNMTVETEMVTSMLQLGGVGGTGASIRSKKSTDTIRPPKKEKKPPKRKAMNTSSIPPSSKADIFAAKVAEAVDEANSSSEENFVYESNPPEPSQRPSRYHSRTPSATSIHDPRARNQSFHDIGAPGPRTKKFARHNGVHTSSYDGDGTSYGTGGASSSKYHGSVSQSGGSSATASRASKYQNTQSYHSINADESPFIPGHKPSHQSLRQAMAQISSRTSPPVSKGISSRSNGGTNGNGFGMSPKKSRFSSSRHGMDEEVADNESLPLITPQHRVNRYRGRRPGSTSLRQLEHNQFRRRSWFGRFAGCIIAIATVFLVISGTIGFMFATSKPLEDVKILKITDVLVSQQEIMLDLIVQAVNPNVVGVTVQSMDINLFAKSSWVRDDKGKDKDKDKDNDKDKDKESEGMSFSDDEHLEFKSHFGNNHNTLPSRRLDKLAIKRQRWLSPRKGVDEGTDPDPDPDKEDKQTTMLLGRILHFDSALIFDGSPFQHRPSISKGGLRLAKPGNKTEEGGTERWERVILHPFELIVRGILKYQLPLSGRIRTASIGGSVMVNPVDGPTVSRSGMAATSESDGIGTFF